MTSAGPALPPRPPAYSPDEGPDPYGKKGVSDKGFKDLPKRDGDQYFSVDGNLPELPDSKLGPKLKHSAAASAASAPSRQGWIVLEASEAAGDIYAVAQKNKSTDLDMYKEWIELYAEAIAEHNFPDNLFSRDLAREWVLHVELNHPFCSHDREDLAHVMGHKVFPDNQHLADLYTQKLMGEISPEGSEELSEAFKKMGR